MNHIDIIIGVVSALCIAGVGAYFKVSISRTFKTSDEKIKEVKDDLKLTVKTFELDKIEERIKSLERKSEDHGTDITRLVEANKLLAEIKSKINYLENIKIELFEKYTKHSDFIKDFQIITSNLETIHNKIERIDEKIFTIIGRGD